MKLTRVLDFMTVMFFILAMTAMSFALLIVLIEAVKMWMGK